MAMTPLWARKPTESGERGLGSGSGGFAQASSPVSSPNAPEDVHGRLQAGQVQETVNNGGGLAALTPGLSLASCPAPPLSLASRKGLLSACPAAHRGGGWAASHSAALPGKGRLPVVPGGQPGGQGSPTTRTERKEVLVVQDLSESVTRADGARWGG